MRRRPERAARARDGGFAQRGGMAHRRALTLGDTAPMRSHEQTVGSRERPRIIALFGPTGVGKTAIAVALAGLLRAQGEDPVAVSADALQVYEGLQTLTGAATWALVTRWVWDAA